MINMLYIGAASMIASYAAAEGRWCLLVMAIAIMGLNLWVVMNK